jgi:murein DD-endopeptidase MepM/ murein hydrolase activator NlpD
MKNRTIRALTAATAGLLLAGSLAACTDLQDYNQRKTAQKSTTISNSLEKRNLESKLQRENKPNAVRYVYLMNFGKIVGYYVIKGKVSSSGSQLAPEEDIVRGIGGDGYVVDSAQDDGTYGSGDDGVFFFLADGTMVETTLDYISSDQPLAVDVPRLEK